MTVIFMEAQNFSIKIYVDLKNNNNNKKGYFIGAMKTTHNSITEIINCPSYQK